MTILHWRFDTVLIVAFLPFPADNLLEHIQDPLHKTFADNAVSLPSFFIL